MAVLINGYLVNLKCRTDAEVWLVYQDAIARHARVTEELSVIHAEIVRRGRGDEAA